MMLNARTCLIAAGICLAACEQPTSPAAPSAPPAAPGSAPAPSPTAPDATAWTLTSSGEGSALMLGQPGRPVQVRIACLRGERELQAEAAALSPIPSEERFTLGLGDEAFTLVADLSAASGPGVKASGPRDPDLLARLERGERVSISYGAQAIGPLPVIPEPARKAFVTDCCDASVPTV